MFAILAAILAIAEVANSSLVYPNQGQSREQQSQDLRECYARAREETDFDPAKPIPKEDRSSPEKLRQRQERIRVYNQVLNTCLQERGYTVQ